MKKQLLIGLLVACLVLGFSSAFSSSLPVVKAATTVATSASVSVTPNPCIIGAQANITMRVSPPPQTSTVYHGLVVTVTAPDGTLTHMGPYFSSTDGSTSTSFTPIMVGTYTFLLQYPGETSPDGSTVFSPSTTASTLVVQSPTPSPVPTSTPPPPTPTPVASKTQVTGILVSDTTWTQAGSPYGFTGPVAVNTGVTLTVQPGAVVYLNGYYLQVNGTLTAKGTSANPVQLQGGMLRFTPASNGWNSQTNSGCTIEYANLTSVAISASNPLKLNQDAFHASSITLGKSSVVTNSNVDAPITAGDSSTFSGNQITDYIYAGASCTFTNNKVGGISAGDTSTVTGNTVSGTVFCSGNLSTISGNVIGGQVTGGTITNNTISAGISFIVQGTTVSNNTILGGTVNATSAITNNVIVSGYYSDDFRVFGGYATYNESTAAIVGSGAAAISGNTITGGGTFTSAFIFTSSTTIVPAIDLYAGDTATIANNAITGRSGIAINGNAAQISGNTLTGDITASAAFVYNNTVNGAVSVSGGTTSVTGNAVTGSITVGTFSWNVTGNRANGIVASLGNGYISDNTVTGNGNISSVGTNGTMVTNGTGISVSAGAIIQRNTIGNFSVGISIAGGTVTIANNTIAGNGVGIFMNSSASTTNIHYNNIQSNGQSVYLMPGSVSNVDATLNWWGTADIQAINQSIFDFKRDFNLGVVNFMPILTAPNSQAAPTMQPSPTPAPTPTPATTSTPTLTPTSTPTIPELQVTEALPLLFAAMLLAVAFARKAKANRPQPLHSSPA